HVFQVRSRVGRTLSNLTDPRNHVFNQTTSSTEQATNIEAAVFVEGSHGTHSKASTYIYSEHCTCGTLQRHVCNHPTKLFIVPGKTCQALTDVGMDFRTKNFFQYFNRTGCKRQAKHTTEGHLSTKLRDKRILCPALFCL